jgi:transcription elongation factor GreA
LTLRGAELLKEELQRLKSVERPAVIEAIAEARSQHGDLSENAEYDAQKSAKASLKAVLRTGRQDFAMIINPDAGR